MSARISVARPLLLAGLAAALAAGCSNEPELKALCGSDAECVESHDGNAYWVCDGPTGRCACTADAACPGGEHCETIAGDGDGLCHPNRSCEWNPDCPQGYCDTTTGICRLTGCSIDLQCGFGQVCDSFTHACVGGCRSHGDCAMGEACLCLDGEGNEVPCTCDGSDDQERQSCPVGFCAAGTCVDKTFCDLGEKCSPPPSPTERNVCEPDERGPFCDNCVFQPGVPGGCGSEGPNFCLIDTSDSAGRQSFCGVDCSQPGQDCPNGFSCHDVLVLTQSVCRSDTACVPTGGECRDDAGCPPGSRCVKGAGQEVGRCGGRCAIGEGDQSGFCTCVTDSDCPQQTCGSDGRCTITRQRCQPGTTPDPCMGSIFCVNNGEVGYCQIGRNCAPDEGITCADVRCARDGC